MLIDRLFSTLPKRSVHQVQCSNCSATVRPVVAIDIDGTLGDYHQHLADFAAGYLGIDSELFRLDPYDGSIAHREWFCQTAGVTITTYRDIKLAYRQGAQKRSMPVFEGASHVVDTLKGLGAEVWVATTRPWQRLDRIDPDTRAWLDRHNIKYDGLVYSEDKYQYLLEQVDIGRVVAVLDDLPEQYDMAAEVFGEGVPILRKNMHNIAVSRPTQSFDLYDGLGKILERMESWRHDNPAV